MSSVYGYYASSISSTSSGSTSLGISGLVSGLDIDSLVEAQTSTTSSKISKVQQNLMKLQWKQEKYQDVGTALTDFKSKYLSSSSSSNISNLLSNSFKIESQGDNSEAVSATGSSSILSNFSVLSVNQLAANASYTSSSGITNTKISSEGITFEDRTVSTLEGESLNIKVGDDSYSIELGSDIISDLDSAISVLQAAVDSNSNADLKDKITIGKTTDANGVEKLTITSNSGDLLTVSSSSSTNVLKALGLSANSDGVYQNDKTLSGVIDTSGTSKTLNFSDSLEDAYITFDLDGVKGQVTFSSDDVTNINAATGEDGDTKLDRLVSIVESKLQKSFGSKVSVEKTDDGGIAFSATNKNSILSVAYASDDLTGDSGIFKGINVGDANRLLTAEALEDSNFANKFDFGDDESNTYSLTINGVDFTIGKYSILVDGKETTTNSAGITMKNVMTAINGSDAGVTMSYLSTTDRITVSSTAYGASGSVEMSGSFADMIFGSGAGALDADTKSYASASGATYGGDTSDSHYTAGQDAEILVSFDGKNVEKITRSTNSFTVDGLSLNLNKTFNTDYTLADDGTVSDADGNTVTVSEAEDAITFKKTADTESLVTALKEMTDDYNALIEKVVDYYTTKPDSDYQPLTADMIEDENLTDEQAEEYNDKAAEGVLFGDSILNSLLSDIRTVFTNMANYGFTTSSDYTEYGKVTFDSETFLKKFEADSENMINMFTEEASGTNKGGVLTRLDSLMTKYVNSSLTSPGLITKKAGLASSSLSQMNSSLYSEMLSMKNSLSDLQDRLETEQDRYYSQYSNMEVTLSNLNSQSAYLQQL